MKYYIAAAIARARSLGLVNFKVHIFEQYGQFTISCSHKDGLNAIIDEQLLSYLVQAADLLNASQT